MKQLKLSDYFPTNKGNLRFPFKPSLSFSKVPLSFSKGFYYILIYKNYMCKINIRII